ncbi:BnaA04g12380D [Brassica napus]|uniref:BnaA04g12380D protein n=2 Tax=Brassica napus TaxID=3708 RepID=A0A078FU31_BRANA|nr:BnaA04g12380D [Brassica napus]
MDDKIFVLDPSATCLVFDPRVGALVEWDDGVEMRSLWQASSCVVDDMLYTVDPGCSLKHPIVVYDPKAEERRWRPVYGVDLKKDLPPFDSWYDSKMANHGGKLVILIGSNPWPCFHHGRQDVWCVEIALERQGDDIWGHVESTTLVLTSRKWPSIELSRSVTL